MAIGFLALLAIQAVLFVASALLAPKPKLTNQKPQDPKPPRSDEGSVLPVAWGTVKVPVNVTDLSALYAKADQEKVKTGIFSSKKVTVAHEYWAVMQAVICHGPVDELIDIVVDEKRSLSGNWVYKTPTTDAIQALGFAMTTVVNPMVYKPSAPSTTALPLTIPGDGLGVDLIVNAPNLMGGPKDGGGFEGHMAFFFGSQSQEASNALRYEHSVHTPVDLAFPYVPRYQGVCYAVFGYNNASAPYITDGRQFSFGENPNFPGIHFLIRRTPNPLGLATPNINGGANPANMVWEILTNTVWGHAIPEEVIDKQSFIDAGVTLASESMGLNMMLSEQDSGDETVAEIMRYVDGQVQQHPITGMLEFTLNRGGYTPSALPLLDDNNSKDVTFSRPSWQAMKNEVKVIYTAKQGVLFREIPTQPVQDLGAQRNLGQTVQEVVQFPAISDPVVANRLAVRSLRMVATPLGKISLTTNRYAADFKTGTLFRVTLPNFDLIDRVFRVLTADYGDLENGEVKIEAVEDVFAFENPMYTSPAETLTPNSAKAGQSRMSVETTLTTNDTTGISTADLTDPDSQFTKFEWQTRYGLTSFGAWHLNTTPMVFQESVLLHPKHPSAIFWRVSGIDTDGVERVLIDGGDEFPVANAPYGMDLIYTIDEATGQVSVTAEGDPETTSVKFAASVTGYPDDATTRAAAADSSAPFQANNIITLEPGQTGYITAFPYNGSAEGIKMKLAVVRPFYRGELPPSRIQRAGLYAMFYNDAASIGSFTGPVIEDGVYGPVDFTNYAPNGQGAQWSVRMTGTVRAKFTQVYTFYITLSGAGRLWVNNKLLVNVTTPPGSPTEYSGTIALTAGEMYPVKIEHWIS